MNLEGAVFVNCDGGNACRYKLHVNQLPIKVIVGKRYWLCYMFDSYLWIGRQRSKMFCTEVTSADAPCEAVSEMSSSETSNGQ